MQQKSGHMAGEPGGEKTDPHTEERLDEALDESFPASDPASVTRAPPEQDITPNRQARQKPAKPPKPG